MENRTKSFFDKAIPAPLLAGVILSFGLVLMLICKILIATHTMDIDNLIYWAIAAICMLLYAMFNSVLSLSAKDMNQYWFRSTASYIGLMVLGGLLAYLFSGITVSNAGFFKYIFMVVTFGYLSFLSMMRFMRKIVQIAQKEDKKWEKLK